MNNLSPEVCNIDQEGIRLRKNSGLILILLGDIFSVLLIINFLPQVFILLIFSIYFFGILNLIQAQQKFCVVNAVNGYDGINKSKDNFVQSIKQRKLLKIFIQTLLATSAITILVYVLVIAL